MDESYHKTVKTLLTLLIAVAILAAVIFLLLLLPAFVETTLPNDSYEIRITGLSDLAVNGTATVMIPVPANAEGELVMFEASSVRQPTGWRAAVRETQYGKMLAFTTTEGYAQDVFMPFGEFETKEEPRLLVPVLATPDNASVAGFTRGSGGTYTTVVFLDGFVPPENATSISFDLRYRGGGGMKHLIKEDTWTATVDATVPGTASGFVPVPAGYHVIAGGINL
ncbi:hypothetical protein F8E02_03020 [Methanoculleus sp. Wushi-C6]|uniref:Uncharacterized protein n=1 Tax=Methanoculleus caldifontis TaxID=2651577 RepID=A0ABU3WZK4_9EURY|nr:hypothetical protein [Methanoculleus sp. Wushi-C6]MDV2480995.1 hypothetical protein [Methanoculleus sp. Wushi-C6]